MNNVEYYLQKKLDKLPARENYPWSRKPRVTWETFLILQGVPRSVDETEDKILWEIKLFTVCFDIH